MAQDYDEKRPDVAEREEKTLEQVRSMESTDTLGVEDDLGEFDTVEDQELPGAFIDDELVVSVKPRTETEFTCGECFLIRDHSMLDHEKDGMKICRECAAS